MKTIGIIRHIDSLGRLVIPKEIRNYLNIGKKDKIEIIALDNGVFLKKADLTTSEAFQKNNNADFIN